MNPAALDLAEAAALAQAPRPPAPPAPPTAGRADYDQLLEFHGIEPGEPIFVIRGRDAVAGDTVRSWTMLASAAGAPAALLEQALRQADKLDAWPVKKVPDAGHLSEAEQQQLVYCMQRRAWSARDDALDLRVFLAEQRSLREAQAELAPLKRRLETVLAFVRADLLAEAREALFLTERAIAASHEADADHDPEAAARFRDEAHAAHGRAEGLARAHALLRKAAEGEG